MALAIIGVSISGATLVGGGGFSLYNIRKEHVLKKENKDLKETNNKLHITLKSYENSIDEYLREHNEKTNILKRREQEIINLKKTLLKQHNQIIDLCNHTDINKDNYITIICRYMNVTIHNIRNTDTMAPIDSIKNSSDKIKKLQSFYDYYNFNHMIEYINLVGNINKFINREDINRCNRNCDELFISKLNNFEHIIKYYIENNDKLKYNFYKPNIFDYDFNNFEKRIFLSYLNNFHYYFKTGKIFFINFLHDEFIKYLNVCDTCKSKYFVDNNVKIRKEVKKICKHCEKNVIDNFGSCNGMYGIKYYFHIKCRDKYYEDIGKQQTEKKNKSIDFKRLKLIRATIY